MIPSRDRPDSLRLAIQSVMDTSDATVAVWVDEDQRSLYAPLQREFAGATWAIGPRIGPAVACNRLAEQLPGFSAYGLITDDSLMTTPGWDRWLLDQKDRFPDGIFVASPAHNHGYHVDMPFVTREWVDALGWFSCPTLLHYAWPTVIHFLALGIGKERLIYAPADKFWVQHDQAPVGPPENQENIRNFILRDPRGATYVADSCNLYRFFLYQFDESIQKLAARLKP